MALPYKKESRNTRDQWHYGSLISIFETSKADWTVRAPTYGQEMRAWKPPVTVLVCLKKRKPQSSKIELQRKATSKIINHQRSSKYTKIIQVQGVTTPFWGWLKAKATSQSCGFVPQRLEPRANFPPRAEKTFGMSLDSISWCILSCIIHPYIVV